MSNLYKKYKVNDTIIVTGRRGTNGSLKYGELYDVIALTEDNDNRDVFYYASQPVIVLDEMGKEVKPFLGKFE